MRAAPLAPHHDLLALILHRRPASTAFEIERGRSREKDGLPDPCRAKLGARFEAILQKLIYHVATSIDGFIAREDDSYHGFPMEGDHVDAYLADLRAYSAVVMGRVTYGIGVAMGVLDPYPWLETHVFSRSASYPPTPDNVTIHRDDPVPIVRALKERDGRGIYLAGGGLLAATLFRSGLVDEVWIKLSPILFGRGKALFGPEGASHLALRRIEATPYASGVVLVKYAVG